MEEAETVHGSSLRRRTAYADSTRGLGGGEPHNDTYTIVSQTHAHVAGGPDTSGSPARDGLAQMEAVQRLKCITRFVHDYPRTGSCFTTFTASAIKGAAPGLFAMAPMHDKSPGHPVCNLS